jgi:hypothetical protein
MLLEVSFLGGLGIGNPESRAKTATYWAPKKSKSFTAVLHVAAGTLHGPAMYDWYNGSRMDRDIAETWKISYFSTLKEGETLLTGKPGSY